MGDDPAARLKQLLASGEARLLPLTFPQRELWETSPVPPGDASNNVCSFFEIRGPLTFDQCEDAVTKVAQRQEAMRTSFLPGKERPLQMVRSTGEAVLRYRELSEEEARPEALLEVMDECFREPFDFLRGPLYRMDMLRRGPEDFVVAFTIHHAVADGWTLGAFVEDLCTAYVIGVRQSGKALGDIRGVRNSMSPVPMSYSRWGAEERARWTAAELERHATYWRGRLAGSQMLWESKRNADVASDSLQQVAAKIPADLVAAARKLARGSGATLFSTLLAAFQVTLFRWTGIADITVGTPVANRNSASLRETMGYFSGIVPLRGQVVADQPFLDRLRSVDQDTRDDFGHAMPFAELAKALGDPAEPGRHTVFDTRFALQNHPLPDVVLPGISTKLRTSSTGTVRFDLGCEMTEEDGGLEVVWLHRPSVISQAEIRNLDEAFRNVLAAVCREPGIRPAAIDVSPFVG
jgi:hypothetical protein